MRDLLVQIEPCQTQLLATVLVDQLHRGTIFLAALEIVAGNVIAEDALGQLVVLEQRRAGEADEGRVGQRQAHVARKFAGLGAVRLVRDHDDVVAVAVGFTRLHILVELVNQAEQIAVILLQQLLQFPARTGARGLVVGHAAADEGLVDLAVQIVPVGHQHKGEIALHRAPHFFGEEGHGVGLAAALGVPHHPQAPKIGVRPLDDLQGAGFSLGITLAEVARRQGLSRSEVADHRLIDCTLRARQRQLDKAMLEPLARRKPALDLLLPNHRRDSLIHTQHLMVARHHLAHCPGFAGVEQDEVLDDVQQTVLGQHAVDQHLGGHAALVPLVQALPFAEVFPGAGDRAIAGAVAIADDQQCIVVEGMGDDVLVEVIAQIAVEAGADILVDRLQFDEYQRQAIDEADQVGAAVVVGRAQPGDLEFAHRQKAIVRRLTEIDHPRLRVPELTQTRALGVAVAHRHAVADQIVEGLIVLEQGARIVMMGELDHRFVDRHLRQSRIEPFQRRPQIAHQHDFALAGPSQRTVRTEAFLIPGVDAVPTQHLFQMLGKGRLNQTVFAVDVGVSHRVYWLVY